MESFLQSALSVDALVLAQVIMIDLMLAGDNAVVIGIAAAQVAPEQRKKVIFWGLAVAVGLRIALAWVAVELLAVIGLMLAGGILLLWVSWRFYRDIRAGHLNDMNGTVECAPEKGATTHCSMRRAITQIFLADISMSLDNVLGVAGAAREHPYVLAIGLVLSIALMGLAAGVIAKVLQRHHWVSYVGLAIVVYVALSMIWDGAVQIQHAM